MSRHDVFHALHQSGCFVMPNAWDKGSAIVIEKKGAKALGTTSAGHAFTLGKPDFGLITRDEALAHAQDLLAVTTIPLSGDFENGFGHTPDYVAETVRLAAEIGLSGCSIEDTKTDDGTSYDIDLSIERIKAGAAAAKSLAHPFVFCARADGVMLGNYDLEDGIKRLQAYENAGADLLYLPAPPDMAALGKIVQSVTAPVNGLAAGGFLQHSIADFAKTGVRRISLGSSIARMAQNALLDACKAIFDQGDFAQCPKTVPWNEIDAMLSKNEE